MTKGKWYGCKQWKSPVDFIKLECVYDDQAYFTECLNGGNYIKEKQNWWAFVSSPLFEADMSIVSLFLPDGHPDKIVAEESSFVLPEKWCIKVTEENIDTLGKWRSAGPLPNRSYAEESWYLHTPKKGAKGYNEPTKDPDYTEITFEQFKQHVLKESPIVESPKEIDMKEIQEEAKKRFPIGCKFIPVDGDNTYTLIENDCTYKINNKSIWAHNMHGYLYLEGKWATLVSLPESEEKSIPEYVKCIRKLSNTTIGKIYKVIDDGVCESDNLNVNYLWITADYIASTKEEYEAQNAHLKLFPTYEKAVNFSNQLLTSSSPKIFDISKLTPLEICRQRYKKGMRVMSADNSGVYSGEFIIEVDPDKFSKTGNSIDYLNSKGWLYSQGKYAEILDTTVYADLYDPCQIKEIKKETFIDNVHSVNVILRTKKKIIKF